MKATDGLKEEHRIIERVLVSIEQAANLLRTGEKNDPSFFIEATDFIKGFADGCHHKKEEGVLFPALIESGMSQESGPVAVMLSEHTEGRRFTKVMREAAERMLSGDSSAKDQVIKNARSYVSLLRQHIVKEDNILFPMVDNVIPQMKQQNIMIAFEQIEHQEAGEGMHEKYSNLAAKLERDAFNK
jgi:hemerythrin-like domain-containing protein